MSHDPLCRGTSGSFCDCLLIARVCEDERRMAVHRIMSLRKTGSIKINYARSQAAEAVHGAR